MVEISLEPIKSLLIWFSPHAVYDHDTETIHITEYATEGTIEEALSHEWVHRTLCILEGKQTSRALDYLEGIEI